MIRFEHRGVTFYATKYKIHPGFAGNREEPPEPAEIEVLELAVMDDSGNPGGLVLDDWLTGYLMDGDDFYDALLDGLDGWEEI